MEQFNLIIKFERNILKVFINYTFLNFHMQKWCGREWGDAAFVSNCCETTQKENSPSPEEILDSSIERPSIACFWRTAKNPVNIILKYF